MSDVIRLLPDSVANQIAAGEVIQRPSSVVKELVENSIDAGATLIQVVVVDAGKSCLQVIDNGKGMSETDARLAFERHATSKISEAADLFSLRTMGFRGEALPSIAAVAQVELRTKMAGQDIGVSLVIEGGKVKEQNPVTCPVGANFSVKNLFFNIPARRKFLKSNQTELGNILSEIERIALAHPETSFTLHNGDNLVLNLKSGNFKQRIVGIFGKKMDAQLIPLHVETSLVNISGYVGHPGSARKKGAPQFFFVNGRYMRHPYFNKAVQSAFDRLVADGEQIPYFISFQVDPSNIDVNIHPQKTEIKFQDEQTIWPIILAAVREALGKSNSIPTIDFDTENKPDIPMFQSGKHNVSPPTIQVDLNFNPFDAEKGEKPLGRPAAGYPANSRYSSGSHWEKAFESAMAKVENKLVETCPTMPELEFVGKSDPEGNRSWSNASAELFQYVGRFIVTPDNDGLLIVDQHRAHVRILYDRFMRQLKAQKGVAQGMLFPQLLQLPSSSAVVMDGMISELQYVGFELSSLGDGAYSVLGVPSGIEGLDPVELLSALVDEAVAGQVRVKEEVHHHIAMTLAKKAALPVGQILEKNEMVDLLNRLFETENPNLTPDGCVVVSMVSKEKIERLFA